MSKNIDNMETKIRLQNSVVVNAYCRDFLPPVPPHRTRNIDRTERPHLTVHPIIQETH